ncbi:MAG TPA: hypothetical protein DIW37_10000 [Chryseobacterium sp.]|nr:hypothetical protein [Chryseobacterium sp.]
MFRTVKRKSRPFYFSAKLHFINDKTCRFILKDAFFFKQVGNYDEKYLLWVCFNVRFGSAQRTVDGLVYNDSFKMKSY